MNKVELYIYDTYEVFIEKLGYEVVDVVYKKTQHHTVLSIFIDFLDKDHHIDLDECEKLSRILSDRFDLDENFPIFDAYQLEISSPGIDRPLKRVKDFKKFVDEKIELSFYKPTCNEKKSIGILKNANENEIEFLRADGEILKIKYEDIAKANLYFEF